MVMVGNFQRLAESDEQFSTGLEHDAFTLPQHVQSLSPVAPTNGRSTR